MLLIIDTNILHKVFNYEDPDFPEYKSVFKCISRCKGVMIYGGNTFTKEYGDFLKGKKNKNRKLIIELVKKKRILELPNKDEIDALEKKLYLIEKYDKKKFNDAHLIACAIIGKCKLICTDDSTSDTYIRDPIFYPKSTMRPSIYRNKNHEHLLNKCWP